MRVAIVIEHFAQSRGGVEACAVRVVWELLKRGNDVSIVCRTAEPPLPPGATVTSVSAPRFWQPLRLLVFSRKAEQATARGFDIVHSFSRTRHQQIYRAGGGSHATYMQQVYRHPSLQRSLSPRHRAILHVEEAVFGDPTQLIQCVSRRVAHEIATGYGVAPERLAVVYNGVDTERFRPERRDSEREKLRRELGLGEPVALFVGTGFRRKGLDRAIRGLAASGAAASLLVAGRGDARPYRQLAQELGVASRTHFLGQRADVESLHAAADLLVMPTRYDPFANAVLEGMASGLAVATTPENGVSELIEHGRNGLIYANDFAPAFSQLANPDELSSIGAAARRTAERFSWAHHTDQLLELYAKVRT